MHCATPGIPEKLQTGLEHHRSGRLSEAAAWYRQILESDPRHPDALHLLGVIAQQQGDYPQSVRLIQAAIESSPTASFYHNNLGNTFHLAGNLSQAIESYRRALVLDASDADVHHNLACVLVEHGDFEEAAKKFEEVLNLQPQFAEAHFNFGNFKKQQGKLESAAESYRRAIAFSPNRFEFHFNLAATLFAMGNFADSADSYRRALSLKPDYADAHYSLGVALQENGELEAAIESYLQTLEIDPNYAQALSNLGAVYTLMGELSRAADVLLQSVAAKPSADAHCNLGKLYLAQGDALKAIECYRNALALESTHAPSLCSLGTQLEILGDFKSSMQCYQLALQHHPEFALARFYLGIANLSAGNFAEGWSQYESRWQTPEFRTAKRTFTQPQWRGEAIKGTRILVFSEQGLGDTLQFVRYVPMLAAAGATVLLEVQPALRQLLRGLKGAEQIFVRGDELPAFDWQCPLMSLPLAFRTNQHSIPANVPYIAADESAAKLWSKRLGDDCFRVGIVWSGNPKHPRERYRSVAVEQLAQLSRIPGTSFYSLQKGPSAKQVDDLPRDLRVVNLDAAQSNFADTAAIVANLDLVISIDTSVAHLAGAMGKPVWILLHHAPDWRWLRDRDESLWYPTARLFRQATPGQWDDVLDRVRNELEILVNSRVTPNRGDLTQGS